MFKIESENGNVTAEMQGSITDISVDFSHAAISAINEIGKSKEEAGIVPAGEGALRVLSTLIIQFIARCNGAQKNPFAIVVKADEFKAMHGRVCEFIKAEIDAFSIDEIEEIKLEDGFKMVLDFLLGVKPDKDEPEQEQPEVVARPKAVWMNTSIPHEWECSNCKTKMLFVDGVNSNPLTCPMCDAEMLASVVPEGGPDGEK